MFVEQIATGGDRNFAYLVADEATGMAAAIDPSYDPDQVVRVAQEHGFTIRYVFHTHDHIDHTNGGKALERLTGRRPLLLGDADRETGQKVQDGAHFPLGRLEIVVLHTPGHTGDSICLYVGDAVFTGDTLFVGKVGGTDLGAGARAEYHSLHDKLMALPDNTRVYPGHDYGVMPESTILRERQTNPFLTQPDFEAFVHLKATWATYKREHGIA